MNGDFIHRLLYLLKVYKEISFSIQEPPPMTLTKSHLIDAIVEQNGFTKKKSTETVETILEIIKSTLAVSRRNGISVIN
jgi:hypothetical protein